MKFSPDMKDRTPNGVYVSHLRDATMARLFQAAAIRHPRREALVADGARLSFLEVDARAGRIAAALAGSGIGRGDVVGALLLDGVAMVELLIATAKLGATLLAMNWRLAAPELAVIMADAAPRVVFASGSFAQLAQGAATSKLFIIPDADAQGLGAALGLTNASAVLPGTEVSPDDPWYLLYTSGTTGRPKGCLHSQGGYYVNTLALSGWCGIRDSDRCLLNSPLYHVGGLSNFLAWFAAGACTVIPPRHASTETTLRLVSAEEITIHSLPLLDPKGYLDLQRRLKLPLKTHTVIGGGGMSPVALLRDIRDTLNVDMILGYGQSEVGGFVTFLRLADQLERPSSCGKPLPHMEVRIVDDSGNDLSDGTHGELLVRSPAVTIGYLNLPEATAEALGGGWLRTGDLFWRDGDGFLHYAGRRKELIKTGGENVYPAEVEKLLAAHPSVQDVCIAGIRDARFGEAVKAFIVLKPGAALTPRQAADFCRGTIAGYKRPRFVEFINEIPRNFQGKPHRATLSARTVTPDQAAD